MKKEKGFTVIELTIVVVVIGILVAIATPQFIDFKSSALTASKKSANGAVQSALGIYIVENQTNPTVTQLASYVQESNVVAVSSGVRVTIGSETHVVPTYTDITCQTQTTSAVSGLVACVGNIST